MIAAIMSDLSAHILHEDAHILVFNKPAGLLSQPTHDLTRPHVVGVLSAYLTRRDGEPGYLALHHRLDLPTSGVMVLARSKHANKPLMNLFKQRLANKTYHALCIAPQKPLPARHTNHLRAQKGTKRGPSPMVEVHAGGDRADTSFEVLAMNSSSAHVLAHPHTGRRHQIRAHLSQLDAPILGDDLYDGPTKHLGVDVPRVMLHAYALSFPHPDSGEEVEFVAPLPEDFLDMLEALGLSR